MDTKQVCRGWFGDGARATLRVTAIYRRGLGFANLTLPAQVLRPHTASGLDSIVLVADTRGSDHADVSAALTHAVHRLDPAAQVAMPSGYQAAAGAQIAQNMWTIQVSVFALLVGGSISALTLIPMVKGTTGSATPYIPAGGWLAVIGGTILLSVTGNLLPILGILRAHPIEAIGPRE